MIKMIFKGKNYPKKSIQPYWMPFIQVSKTILLHAHECISFFSSQWDDCHIRANQTVMILDSTNQLMASD